MPMERGDLVMMKKIPKSCVFGLALAFLTLAGCKLQIDVPVSGKVITESGGYECYSGQICNIDIYDIHFDETFVAEPDQGFKFVGWKTRDKGLCGGEGLPCHLFTTGFLEQDSLMTVLESDEVFYLEPVFEKVNTCSGNNSGNSAKKITLRQGEFAVREIRVPVDKSDSFPRPVIRPPAHTISSLLATRAVNSVPFFWLCNV